MINDVRLCAYVSAHIRNQPYVQVYGGLKIVPLSKSHIYGLEYEGIKNRLFWPIQSRKKKMDL